MRWDGPAEQAEREPGSEAAPQAPRRLSPAVAAVLGAAAVAAIAAAAAIGAQGAHDGPFEAAPQAPSAPVAVARAPEAPSSDDEDAHADEPERESAAAHEHSWEPVYETVSHEAETEQVEVPAQYERQTSLETVCNACGATVTGAEAEHRAQTGHSAFTPGVPVERDVETSPAHTEEKVVKEAFDEQVETGRETCSTCGAVRQKQ